MCSSDLPGLEDLLCAGLMTERLLASGVEAELTDAARIGLVTYRHLLGQPETDPVAVLYQAQHTKGLDALGFADDITYCAQIDTRPCLVRFRDGRITLVPEANPAHGA